MPARPGEIKLVLDSSVVVLAPRGQVEDRGGRADRVGQRHQRAAMQDPAHRAKMADIRGAYGVLSVTLVVGAVIICLAGLVGWSAPLLVALSVGMGFCIAGGQFCMAILPSIFYSTYIRATGVAWASAAAEPGAVMSGLLGTLLLTWHWPLATIFLVDRLFPLCAAAAVFLMGASQHGKPLHPRTV
jgi:MFS family permease